MKLSETALKLAFFGMHCEARDIIDFLAICFSVFISIMVGVVAALWIGHVVDAPVGFIAGIGFYGLSLILCSFALLHGHRG
jgi:sorbitol-specific phosphotransferase system component IIBC